MIFINRGNRFSDFREGVEGVESKSLLYTRGGQMKNLYFHPPPPPPPTSFKPKIFIFLN